MLAALIAGAKALGGEVAKNAVTQFAGEDAAKDMTMKIDGKGLSTKEKAGSLIEGAINKQMSEGKAGGTAGASSTTNSAMSGMNLGSPVAGKLDNKFYGHYLSEHFKKTEIIKTTGRVR